MSHDLPSQIGRPIKDPMFEDLQIRPDISTNRLIIVASVKRFRTAGYRQIGYSEEQHLGKTTAHILLGLPIFVS
jgi:hypothetical protein